MQGTVLLLTMLAQFGGKMCSKSVQNAPGCRMNRMNAAQWKKNHGGGEKVLASLCPAGKRLTYNLRSFCLFYICAFLHFLHCVFLRCRCVPPPRVVISRSSRWVFGAVCSNCMHPVDCFALAPLSNCAKTAHIPFKTL